jgi:L-iditol 2-dehydrogenase
MPIATPTPTQNGNGADHPTATLVEAVENPPLLSQYEAAYDPSLILQHPEFKKLAPDAPELQDPKANLACCYNPAHEVNMVNKPVPKARRGECIVHVRATGICG